MTQPAPFELVGDAQLDVLAVMDDARNQVDQTFYRPADGHWSRPAPLGDIRPQRWEKQADFLLGPGDRVLAVYETGDDVGGGEGRTAALTVSGWQPRETLTSFDGEIRDLDAERNVASDVAVVWADQTPGAQDLVELAYRPAGAGWGSPEVVRQAPRDTSEPAVTNTTVGIDTAGRATVVWREQFWADTDVVHPPVRSARRAPDGTYTPDIRIAGRCGTGKPLTGVQLSVAPDGDSLVVCKQFIDGSQRVFAVVRAAGHAWEQVPVTRALPRFEAWSTELSVLSDTGEAVIIYRTERGAIRSKSQPIR